MKLTKMDRELIYTKLMDKLTQLANFNLASRKLRLWSDVPPAEFPCLFLSEVDEIAVQESTKPVKWYFRPEIYIYVNSSSLNGDDTPYSQLNRIIDAIGNELQVTLTPSQAVTLDETVNYVKINGNIRKSGGVLGDIAVAIIPLEIMIVV